MYSASGQKLSIQNQVCAHFLYIYFFVLGISKVDLRAVQHFRVH